MAEQKSSWHLSQVRFWLTIPITLSLISVYIWRGFAKKIKLTIKWTRKVDINDKGSRGIWRNFLIYLFISNYYKSEPLVNGMVNKSLIWVIVGQRVPIWILTFCHRLMWVLVVIVSVTFSLAACQRWTLWMRLFQTGFSLAEVTSPSWVWPQIMSVFLTQSSFPRVGTGTPSLWSHNSTHISLRRYVERLTWHGFTTVY